VPAFEPEVAMKPLQAGFGVMLALGLVVGPAAADGQQPAKVYRVGFLSFAAPPPASARTPQQCPTQGGVNWEPMLEGFREHGYVPGRNLIIECRYPEGHEDRGRLLAAELVSMKVDLIVAASTQNVRAAKQATSTLPIVMVAVIDPVRRGLVASLARPGGNVTGITEDAGTQIAGKYLQLLREIAPRASRTAVLSYLMDSPEAVLRRDLDDAARTLGMTLRYHETREPEQLDAAFAAMATEGADALLVIPHPFMSINGKRIVGLANRSRLPAVLPFREHVEAGGLLAYDVDRPALRRRIGAYADRIFKGARPADLPVEQPTEFELIVNLRTAKALGITIPPSLLLRADEVIE
jgi:putative ABC transport system substrate-binding protein